MWGRAKVRDLEDEYAARQTRDAKALMERIVRVSLESHVLSRFTAYVAVDKSAVVDSGGQPLEVVQPVELPDGWQLPAGGLGALTSSARLSSHVLCDSISPMSEASPDQDDISYACFDMVIDRRRGTIAAGGGLRLRLKRKGSEPSSPPVESPASPQRDADKSAVETRVDIVRDLESLLEEAIRMGASEISIALDRKRIRIQFLIGGKWGDYEPSPQASWDELLQAVKRRAGIDPASTSWPQQGEIRLREFALPVVITRARKHETVSIQIPPDAASGEGQPDAGPASAEKRRRFWTC
jgi:type II secretory ATPase GspE/PulE/Tfp pilus assembly ATPase PilB-like protein